MSEEDISRETKTASMAAQPPPFDEDHVREMLMELRRTMSQVKALIRQNPEEALQLFREFPMLPRIYDRAEVLLLSVGPPYLPPETDDQAEATYSSQSPPSPPPMIGFPPRVQPSSPPPAEPIFDEGDDLGEPSSPPEEEQPSSSSQTPPNSTRGEKK